MPLEMAGRYQLIIVLLAFALRPGFALAQAPAQPLKTIGLQVRSESWIANSAFDKAGFTTQCATSGIRLAPDIGRDGVIVINYREEQGSGYSLFGVGEPSAWGTNIKYELKFLSPQQGDTLLTLTAEAKTPSRNVERSALHQAAVSAFKAMPQYRLACSAIAAMLGSHAEGQKLLSWAAATREGLEVLQTTGFTPKIPRDRAFVAVGERNWTSVAELGKVANEPLTAFVRVYAGPESVFSRSVHLNTPAEHASLAEAVSLLVAIADPGTPRLLEGLLAAYASWRRDMAPRTVTAALNGLAKIGNAFSLPAVERWTTCDFCQRTSGPEVQAMQEIMAVASEAAKAIRARSVRPK